MADFKCNCCSSTTNAQMPEQPTQNKYWNKIRAVTCERCWLEWKEMEVKIHNEYRLNMLEKEHRQMMKKFMHDHLNVDGTSAGGAAVPKEVAENFTSEK